MGLFPCCFLDYSPTSVDSRGLVGPPPSANGTRSLSWQLTDNWFWLGLATTPCPVLFITAVIAYNTNYWQNYTLFSQVILPVTVLSHQIKKNLLSSELLFCKSELLRSS